MLLFKTQDGSHLPSLMASGLRLQSSMLSYTSMSRIIKKIWKLQTERNQCQKNNIIAST